MITKNVHSRRFDVDTLRVAALLLLILYHAAISFQWFAVFIGFIPSDPRETLPLLWEPFRVINIWRIPILFMVSGMAFAFIHAKRTANQILVDRLVRIGAPLLFITLTFNALLALSFALHFDAVSTLTFDELFFEIAHLWFLVNIIVYVFLFIAPFSYLKNGVENGFFRLLKKTIQWPFLMVFIVAIPLFLETLVTLTDETIGYESFAFTWHGFVVGLIVFFFGYVFVSLKDDFWRAVTKWKYLHLALAVLLYGVRASSTYFDFAGLGGLWSWPSGIDDSGVVILNNALVAIEVPSWILAAVGLSASFLNRPSRLLSYLSVAVFPVYILHLPIQYILSVFIFPLEMPLIVEYLLLVLGVFLVSFGIFEIVKRIPKFRVVFGIKP